MNKNLLYLPLLFWTALPSAAQTLDGAWKGQLEAGPQKLNLTLHIDTDRKTVKMDVTEQGVKDLSMTVGHLSADSLNVSFAQLAMNYAGKRDGDRIAGTFRQGAFSTRLDFERGEAVVNRPQEPRPPFPYTTQDVTFDNASAHVSLAGTLTYPTDFKPGQKVPVVLMVTGSGPQNRDEELFGHKPFLVMADFLARHGIASLRYDDRGVGQSTGNFAEATTQDFAQDAACGLEWLRSRKEFSQVGLLGHSEGGVVGYLLGSRGKTDFLVELAGPACRIDTMMMVQLNRIARVQGAPQDVVQTVDQTRRLLLQQADTPWMKQFIDLDMTPYVEATRCPVLALGGENDLNVPVSLNTPALKAHLTKNKKNLIKVYPGLNHLFQHHPTGNPAEAGSIEETISPEVLADIAAWIKKL